MSPLRHITKVRHGLSVLSCLLLLAPLGHADTPPIDATTVAAWADETFNEALQKHAFSGLTVSVVRDGAMIFSRGYGRADFSRPDPVDPLRTQFRIGSITKTFTATIIAQLVEEGRIASLDDPANRYLRDYQLPDNGGVAITLHHLLTHTAGFEDQFYFIGADQPIATHPPAAVFDSLRPAYVRPAGARVEYSNFGVAVLGRIVEDLTGMGIAQAMEQRIFMPLGMQHTRLLDDVNEPATLGKPATILPDGSTRTTTFTAISPPIAAAGGIASTAEDMARYMLAQLGAATGPEHAPLLNPATLERLHTRRTGNAPDTTGLAMIFFLDEWAGLQTVAHGGNWTGFHSWMTLIPAQKTGIFVSIMGDAPASTVTDDLRAVFLPWTTPPRSPAVLSGNVYARAFLAHFFGERNPLPAAVAPGEAGSAAAGWYRPDRRPFTTAESVADLVYLGAGVTRVDATPTGIRINSAGPWQAVGDGVFMLDTPSRERVVIRPDERVGAPVLIPDLGLYTATRIPWYQHPRLHFYLVLASMLAGAIALMLSRGAHGTPTAIRALAWLAVVGGIALIPLAYVGRTSRTDMLTTLYAGHSGRMAVFVITANLTLIAAAATLIVAIVGKDHPARIRGALTVIGIAGLVLATILASYNVIGWHVPG